MTLLRNETLTITRKAAGTYENGHYVDGTETVISIMANVQPLSGSQILQLAEADREKESWAILTESEIRVNDIAARGGKTYEVQRVEDFNNQPIPHYEGIMLLIEGQP